MTSRDRAGEPLTPPEGEGSAREARIAGPLRTVLLVMLAVAVLVGLALPLTDDPWVGLLPLGIVVLLVCGALVLLRLGYVWVAAVLFSVTLWAFDTVVILVSGGILSPMTMTYIVAIIVVGLLLGGRAAAGIAGLSIVAGAIIFLAQRSGVSPPMLIPVSLATGMLALTGCAVLGAAFLYVATRTTDRALRSASSYATELEAQQGQLSDLIEERTEELTRRTSYLGATTAIAHEAASMVGDPEQLLARAVSVVSEQFGYYHVGLFEIDSSREWAVLRAASGLAGRQMLARQHRLRVGAEGIVGYVASQGTRRVALDVRQDPTFADNPDLPDSQSEAALPLRARGEVIGVLDVQSTEPQAFGEEDVSVLQALADQLAVAISNAQLFREAEDALAAERRARGEIAREAWRDLLREESGLGFVSDAEGTEAAGDEWDSETVAAVRTGRATPSRENAGALAVPVLARGEVVGVIDAHLPADAGGWTPEQRQVMETLAEQLGVALESARLYREAQGLAVRERLTTEITGHMRGAVDMGELLQTAIRETAEALGASRAFVQWVPAEAKDDDR